MSSRRTSLPGAAELFRTTSVATESAYDAQPSEPSHPGVAAVPRPAPEPSEPEDFDVELAPRRASIAAVPSVPTTRPSSPGRSVRNTRRIRPEADRAPSGRERHDEKITVYCSPEELLDLETGRLRLRAEHGLAVDRGRIVREALAVVLADLDAKGESSILVRRLREA
jgi:hypothetical protein